MRDVVNELQRVMFEGGEKAFDIVPTKLKKVLLDKSWASRRDKDGDPFETFEAFVAAELWEGLESSIDDLLVYCRKHQDVQAMIRKEIGATPDHGEIGGGHTRGDIIPSGHRGTSATHALRRLKRDRPDLAERVVSGEISAHAAAIEAGFRRRMFPVPADDAAGAVQALIRRFGRAAVFAAMNASEEDS